MRLQHVRDSMRSSSPETKGNATGGMEPIAICGMACRYSGEASSPSKLWELLEANRSAQSDWPACRIRLDSWYHPDRKRPGSICTKGGYFLSQDDQFRDFDPTFFGINPVEAATMDPQHKKLLEVTYEAFESAGVTLDQIAGSLTACYVGCFNSDFKDMNKKDSEYGKPYDYTGMSMTILSNRINYVFDLRGPSMTVDTACSASMYALHMACQSLASGDCSAALVGGTNLLFYPDKQMGGVRLGILSATSTCHSFDESADGIGRGEGISVLYVKRLSDAVANGDPIRGIIRGTAINTNGKGAFITRPESAGQAACIRMAYAKAHLSFDETAYFECHGTGTAVGDPTECAAVADVFASSRTPEEPLLIGSLKSNLGHTEGAAGIAGIMKVVLGFENSMIPATIGVKKINPKIDLRGGRLKVVTSNTTWPKAYRRASVNSFGYGGANGHVILDATDSFLSNHITRYTLARRLTAPELATEHSESQPSNGEAEKVLVVFSAHDKPTLERNIRAISQVRGCYKLRDIAYTLGKKRSGFASRAFSLWKANNHLRQRSNSEVLFGSLSSRKPYLTFVFTGQGAQWPQMGEALIQVFPLFKETIEQLQLVLDRLPNPPHWNLLGALAEPPESSTIHQTSRSQTLCTALQIALVVLLRSWGIVADAVVGHSSGEIASAFTAGLISLEEAITLAYLRGTSVTECHEPGAMLAVGLGAEAVRPFIKGKADVVIACYNSPESVTLSGTEVALDDVAAELKTQSIFARKVLSSGNGYHSYLMRKAGIHYADLLRATLPKLGKHHSSSQIPFYSCVSGGLVEEIEPGPGHWCRNLEQAVLFDQATQVLMSNNQATHLIEIGPHAALAGPLRQIRSALEMDIEYHSTMKRNDDDVTEHLLNLAGSLFLNGYDVDIESVNQRRGHDQGRFVADLPGYQWNYERITWLEDRSAREYRFRSHPRHDLLGSREPGSSRIAPVWRNYLSLKYIPWLKDHMIDGQYIFPASCYVAMAVEAALQAAEVRGLTTTAISVNNLAITGPLLIPETGSVETVFNLLESRNSTDAHLSFEFRITSVSPDDDNNWTEHAKGSVKIHQPDEEVSTSEFHILAQNPLANAGQPIFNIDMTGKRWYSALERMGVQFGSVFQTLSHIRVFPETHITHADVNLQPSRDMMVQESRYLLHPATIDGLIHAAFIGAHDGLSHRMKPYLPVSLEDVTIWNRAVSTKEKARAFGHGKLAGLRAATGMVQLLDDSNEPLFQARVTLRSLENGPVIPSSAIDGNPGRQPYMTLEWKPDIDRLTPWQMQRLFPNGSNNPIWHEYADQLEELSCLSVVEIADRLTHEDTAAFSSEHGRKFLSWIETTAQDLVKSGAYLPADIAHRRERVDHILSFLDEHVPEIWGIRDLSLALTEVVQDNADISDLMQSGAMWGKIHGDGFSQRAAQVQLQKLIELVVHKNPGVRILEIGGGTNTVIVPVMEVLHGSTRTPLYTQYTSTRPNAMALERSQLRYRTYKHTQFKTLDIQDDPVQQGFEAGSYDIILAPGVLSLSRDLRTALQNCKELLSPHGKLILVEDTRSRASYSLLWGSTSTYWNAATDHGHGRSPLMSQDSWNSWLREAGFESVGMSLADYTGSVACTEIMVASPTPVYTNGVHHNGTTGEYDLYVVYLEEPHELVEAIRRASEERDLLALCVPLSRCDEIPNRSRIFITTEMSEPRLCRMSKEELQGYQHILSNAATAVWVTNGGLLDGKRPEYAMVFGMVKPLASAHPALSFSAVDFDPADTDYSVNAKILLDHLETIPKTKSHDLETQLVVRDGIVYVSRFVPDERPNAEFDGQFNSVTERAPFSNLNTSLDFAKAGAAQSFYFKEKGDARQQLQPNEVRLRSCAYALSKASALAMSGKRDAASFTYESVCVVTEAASDANHDLEVGDRVYCLAPGKMESTFAIPSNLCERAHSLEEERLVLGNLMPYCTAMLTRQDMRNSPRKILIDVSDEVLRRALATLASIEGLDVTLLSADAKLCRNERFHLIMASTDCQTIPSMWSTLAPGGKLVLLGSDVVNVSALDMDVFRRGASFSIIDVRKIISEDNRRAAELLTQTLRFLRGLGTAQIVGSVEQYKISNLDKAILRVQEPGFNGRVNIICDSEAIVPIQRAFTPLTFPHDATYLLIGGLGGLGRSIVTWMFSRGARRFIFLSRSGADNKEAAAFIHTLQDTAASIRQDVSLLIVRGDVTLQADVDRAVAAAKFPIHGAIQASMVVTDSLFERMSLDNWNFGIAAKVQGTANLHAALTKAPLDIFLLISSTIGVLGPATQTPYTASNAYLDAFARYCRMQLGLPATSLSLGAVRDVGYLEANPHVKSSMSHTGLRSISEDEFLLMFERACRPTPPIVPSHPTRAQSDAWDPGAASHIVTGLEVDAVGLEKAVENIQNRVEPRLHHLNAVIQRLLTDGGSGANGSSRRDVSALAELTEAKSRGDKAAVETAVRKLVLEKFASLVSVSADGLDEGKRLGDYGLDSMIMSELRGWCWKALEIDVPFGQLMDKSLTVKGLVGIVTVRIS